MLEGLGWNLIRIWATEWYQHPASCTKDLLSAVEAAKKAPKKKQIQAAKQKSSAKVPKKPADSKVESTEADQAAAVQSPAVKPSLHLDSYVCCEECSLGSYHQFASVPDSVLGTAIVQIVSVEGPVSETVLAARVKELGRVPRMTALVRDRISSVADAEVAEGRLIRDSERFLLVPECVVSPRERPAKWSPADVSLNEIAAAAVTILAKQFSTPKGDLIRHTAVVLGFKATAQVKDRIEAGIDHAINVGLIKADGNTCKTV